MSLSTTKAPTFGDAINAIYMTIIHSCLAVQKAAMGTEEVVDLARNEVKNLDTMQRIRLDAMDAERAQQRITIDAELAEATA